MNDNSKQDHLGKNKFGCILFAELHGRNTRALPRIFRLFWVPPKNPYLNQATQKNTCQIFLPQKIPQSKISNPKKSFNHPRHLKLGVPPLGFIIPSEFIFSSSGSHSNNTMDEKSVEWIEALLDTLWDTLRNRFYETDEM